MTELLVLLAAGAGIWALRASAIVLARGRALPEPATRSLNYAKHAVLAALVASAVTGGRGLDGLALAPALAAVVAIAVAWRTRGTLRTVAAGMATAALVAAVLPF
jgi:branched-subunit amino acid transport protein